MNTNLYTFSIFFIIHPTTHIQQVFKHVPINDTNTVHI